MRVFNVAKGEVTVPLESTREIRVQASGKNEIVLYGMCEKTRIPLETGKNIRFKGTLSEDFDAVKLVAHGKSEFGFMVHERLITEPELSDEDPPLPVMPQSDNLVAKIHRIARQQSSLARGTLEPDDDVPWFNRYVVDDDDWDFEEELSAKASSSQQASEEADPEEGSSPSRTTEGPEVSDVPENAARPDPSEGAKIAAE